MAKQLDLYKAINKHAKAIKVLEQHMQATNELGITTYTADMHWYITGMLVKQYNRHVRKLNRRNAIKHFFHIKIQEPAQPIIVKSLKRYV